MESELKAAGLLGILLIVLAGFVIVFNNKGFSESVELKKFSSYSELENFIEGNIDASNAYGLFGGVARAETATAAVSDAVGAAAGGSRDVGTTDYSETNIQVKGVDEPDIVKNDGKYIYAVRNNKIIITDAYPASEMEIVSELEFDNYVSGIFLQDNKLVVITYSYGGVIYYGGEITADAVVAPGYGSSAKTAVYVYNIYDKGDIEMLEKFEIDGNYYSARMIDDYVYVLANKYVNAGNIELPVFKKGNEEARVAASNIYYPELIDNSFYFTSVIAIDLDELDYKGDVYLTGASSAIYVSKENIYLTNVKAYNYNNFQEELYREVVKIFPGDLRSEIEEILESNKETFEKQQEINEIYMSYFNSLSQEERVEFSKGLEETAEDFSRKWSKENEKTIIHKIEINGLEIDYDGSGEVPGYVLNQFSMDEYDGNFRVATTTGNNWFGGRSESLNHLYVLNDGLKIIGKVEDLASGERIYSARFLGDKAYIVTFRQVDPLYVIDLSEAKNPEVLGYLKVTGFSNYLHPYDKDTLIGIGREASEEGRAQGVKISLFDVSDFENPREIDKYVVEGDWSYSEAEHEHKAVLFDREKNLLVIPVSYSNYDTREFGANWNQWQGAFVFDINKEGIDLRGKVSHNKDSGNEKEFYWNSYVRRSLYMDDVLYTVSDRKVKANELQDLNEIKSVEFGVDEIPVVSY